MRFPRAQRILGDARHRDRNAAARHELHIARVILVLMRHNDAARAALVEQPRHGVPRAGEAGVDHLIAREEHEHRVPHRGAAPRAQTNELDIVDTVFEILNALRTARGLRAARYAFAWISRRTRSA